MKRWNKLIGLSDVPFLFVSTAFVEVVSRLNAMPFLVMAAQLCPKNMEATFFALMMSISNQGMAQGQFLGKVFLQMYNVGAKNADGERDWSTYPTVILIRSGLILGVTVFAIILPNTSALDPSNVSEWKPTTPWIKRLLDWAEMSKEDQEKIENGHSNAEKEREHANKLQQKVSVASFELKHN